jgi:flagellar basal body-associated protein FliL
MYQYQQPIPPVPPKKGGGATLWIVLGGVVVLVIAVVVAIVLLSGSGSNTNTATTTSNSGAATATSGTRTGTPVATTGTRTGTPTAAINTGGWKALSPAGAGFSVDLPGTPKEQKSSQSTAAGNIDIYFYQLTTNSGAMLYQVGYNDYPEGLIQAGAEGQLLDAAMQGGVKAVNGKVVSEKNLTLNGFPGKEAKVSVTSPTTGEFIIRIFLVENRMYQLMSGGTSGKIDQTGMDRFLKSFKLT